MSGKEVNGAAALLALVARHGGAVSARDVQRADGRRYPSARAAAAALNDLVRAGHGSWARRRTGTKGGRPTRVFTLRPPDTTPPVVSGGRTPAPYYADGRVRLYHGDFREVLTSLPDASVDLVLTDPPYARAYLWCWPVLARESYRLLRDRGSLVTLLGHYQVPEVTATFEKSGLRYWWLLAVGQHHRTRLPGKGVCVYWKPALWYVKGRRRVDLPDFPMDFIAGDKPAKSVHPWEQGLGFFRHWCERLTWPGEVVLDPFAGSGTALVAAKSCRRRAVGVEVEERYCAEAARRLGQAAGA
jgi:site-specific DNA-methyltransferase (adenine-specific)